MLTEALDLESVGDGVIQGAGVRLVLRTGAEAAQIEALAERAQVALAAVPARFEDAFIDLLGGGPGGTSALAEKLPPIELGSDIAVSCRNLTKRFGHFTATDNVSLDVHKGEIYGLLGPNGAGKSTTFKMLCGLLKPTSGEAHVVGLDLRRATGAAKSRLGYMAQKFSLYGLLSVRQNLEFSAGVYELSGSARQERIQEMIDTFDLGKWLSATPDSLPLGHKQRLSLACALMHHPPVLFPDEPTSGVDPITRREFWTHINGLARKGVTIMVTTHFMDEAEYCDRVAMLSRAPDRAGDAGRPQTNSHWNGTPGPDHGGCLHPSGGVVRPRAGGRMNDAEPQSTAEAPRQLPARRFDLRRLRPLVYKESLQALRDPSTLLIAFVLPVVLLFLFAYAVSLDAKNVRIGVVIESPGASAQSLAAAFAGTQFVDAHFAHDRREVADKLVSGDLRGYVVIPQDLEQRLAQRGSEPLVQVITDGSCPNTANYVENYARGVAQTWSAELAVSAPSSAVTLEPR